jgi:hypothetical protein
MSRAVAAILLLLTAACTVPTLDELETERPSAECDTAHPCPGGLSCVEGRCVTPIPTECTPDTEAACGLAQGECRAGKKRCDAQGRWGACVGEVPAVTEVCNGKDDDCDGTSDDNLQSQPCELQVGVCAGKRKVCTGGQFEALCSAATYGQDYESQQETRCDNLDNDCDGSTDEALTQLCQRQVGVCAGARVACAGGAFPSCTDATYAAHARTYQAFEQSCDTLDNDCDGRTDGWAPINLSESAALSSRDIAAVAAQEQVLVLHQEGTGMVLHTFRTDGTHGSLTLLANDTPSLRAKSPALVTDGTQLVGAWIEEQSVGPTFIRKIRLAESPGGIPRTRLLDTPLTNPQRVSLAINPERILVLIEDLPQGATRTELLAVTVTRDLNTHSAPLRLSSSGQRAHASAGQATDRFYVAWEGSKALQVSAVANNATLLTAYGDISDTTSATTPFIVPEPIDVAQPDPKGFTVYFVLSSGTHFMSKTCPASGCTSSPPDVHLTSNRPLLNLRVTPVGTEATPFLAAWESVGAQDGTHEVFIAPFGGTTLQEPRRVSPEGLSGHRPVPAVLASNPNRPFVLFDTAGNPESVALRDEALLLPFCL